MIAGSFEAFSFSLNGMQENAAARGSKVLEIVSGLERIAPRLRFGDVTRLHVTRFWFLCTSST